MLLIDAIHVKIWDRQVANRPVYIALAVTIDGRRDILGMLTEVRNRGVNFERNFGTPYRDRGGHRARKQSRAQCGSTRGSGRDVAAIGNRYAGPAHSTMGEQ